MRTRYAKSWPRRAGVTLVEAVAATALLGALLVPIVTARVQVAGQSRRSAERVEACRILDELMNDWWKDISTMPRNGEGPIKTHKGWRWRTQSQPRHDGDWLNADVAAVEVFAPGWHDEPAVRIEVLLRPEEAQSEESQESTDAD